MNKVETWAGIFYENTGLKFCDIKYVVEREE